ncbi:hypothetical protein A6A05_06460 [Magnetospirillum moscoviense]|uniref:histidine kinase n=1 Tax=Magnetospirillum moscoviense TaxID=1437059 RepID=A0A178N0L8_9PROT|nr:hypothetical protein A6A05_06460 [Magnetospirillum moscoviense]
MVRFLLFVVVAMAGVPGGARSALAIELTAEERAFLAAHPTVRVRINGDLPPFLFQDQGQVRGMSIDYLTLVLKRLNLTMEPVDIGGFAEVLKRLPTGDGMDLQPVTRPTPERAKEIGFTRPYLSFPVVIVTRTNADFVGSLDDLNGHVVAVEKAYWYTTELQRKYPGIELKIVDSSSQAIRAVAVGEADAYVGILAVAAWQMEKNGYTNLKIAAPSTLSGAEMGMGVRGDWPLLTSALDKALATITPEEHREIRRKWLPVKSEFGIAPRQVMLWGGLAAGGFLLFIAMLILANRRLIREIGRRRAAEQEVRASQAIALQMLNASTDACMLFDVDGTMRGFNDVFAKRLGVDPATILGSSLWSYFPPVNIEARKRAVAGVVASRAPVTLIDVRGGHHLSNTIFPLIGPDDRVRQVIVYSRDITEQVEAEARIQAHLAEIKRSNAELEQFAYIASHDLREPLRQIANFVALLERRFADQLNDEAREYISFAREGAKRLDNLMLDLLEYSRVGRGEQLAPVECEIVVAAALDNLAARIAETGAEIHIAPGLPTVLGAKTHLIHLFQNLIANALKYCSPERIPEVRLSFTIDGKVVTFSVADNGIGIDPVYHDRIFGIFQRLHGREEYEGTGIGLAICRRVVDQHGGRIWVDSVPGQGSTFHFTVSLATG